MTALYFYPMVIRDLRQKNLKHNMQTNMETTANEATKLSRGISEIRNINVIKLNPWRHQLLYLLDVISKLLEAVQFLTIPIRHCTCLRKSDHQSIHSFFKH